VIVEALADMRDMDVREVMTPRVDVTALNIPVTVDDVARAVRETGHSAFPVVNDDLDALVGILFVTDLFRTRRIGTNERLPQLSALDISRRLRPAHVVPETRGVLETLYEMRRHHRTFAIAVDEYGGVAGVLTLKDLLEPLVGDLNDEFDSHEALVFRVDADRWLVDGRTSLDEVDELIGLELPNGEYVTLGGFLFDAFGHIPEEGEQIDFEGWQLRVVEMEKRRVSKVVVKRPAPVPAPAPAPKATGNGRRPSASTDAQREEAQGLETSDAEAPVGEAHAGEAHAGEARGGENGRQPPDVAPATGDEGAGSGRAASTDGTREPVRASTNIAGRAGAAPGRQEPPPPER
jgi:putative hemolysin